MRKTADDHKVKAEYRITCSGTDAWHTYHAYPTKSLAKGDTDVEALNTSPPGTILREDCKPWGVERREIGPWQPVGFAGEGS